VSESSTAPLDEKDLIILDMLKRNSRTPYSEIAEKLGISKTAVKKRINRLVEMGIIKKFTIEYEVKTTIQAIVLIKILPGYDVPTVASEIAKNSMAENVYEVTGDYDIVVVARTHDVASINVLIDSMRRTRGVASTNTLIVLRSW